MGNLAFYIGRPILIATADDPRKIHYYPRALKIHIFQKKIIEL